MLSFSTLQATSQRSFSVSLNDPIDLDDIPFPDPSDLK